MDLRDDENRPEPPFPLPHGAREELPPALRAVRNRIAADLDATQGAWQRRPLPSRFALLGAAVVLAAAPWVALVPASASSGARAGVLLAAGGALALVAVAAATTRPGLGSSFGVAAAALVALSAVLEMTRAATSSTVQVALKCAGLELLFLLPAGALLAAHLARARLPMRLGHALAVAAGGGAGSAAVWLSCGDTRSVHLALEHAAPVAGAVAVLGVLVLLRSRARPGPLAES